MWSAVGLGAVTLLTVWVAHRWRNSKAEHANLPPGSMGLPFIGEAFQLITPGYSLDLHPFVKTRLQRYGAVFKTSIAGQPVVISADPEVNSHIMLQEGKSVEMRYPEAYNKMFNDDETRINASGFIHRYIRGKALARFGSQRLQESLLPMIEVQVHKELKSWSGRESIDVKKETAKMVLDFTAKQIFGYDPDASSVNLSDKFSNFLGCLLTLPLNVPGTKYYNCMKELDSNVISKNFMPFGGGTRQCAGAEYSKAFMAVFFHKLLTEYRWEKVRGGDVIRNPLMGFKDGIHIKVSVNP
uniref:Cytochrome P450 n=1 Tax=Kalanchoe fedtschenkoi TaxID=63787 RepID=A0A7N0UXV2_KALFE